MVIKEFGKKMSDSLRDAADAVKAKAAQAEMPDLKKSVKRLQSRSKRPFIGKIQMQRKSERAQFPMSSLSGLLSR